MEWVDLVTKGAAGTLNMGNLNHIMKTEQFRMMTYIEWDINPLQYYLEC